jgi:hypothetical protein
MEFPVDYLHFIPYVCSKQRVEGYLGLKGITVQLYPENLLRRGAAFIFLCLLREKGGKRFTK